MLIIVPDETAILEVTRTAGRYYVTVQGSLEMSATCERATVAASHRPAVKGQPDRKTRPPLHGSSRRQLAISCTILVAMTLVGAHIILRPHSNSSTSAPTPHLVAHPPLANGIPRDDRPAPQDGRDPETADRTDEPEANQQRPELPKPRLVQSPDAAQARNAAFGLE